MARNKVKKEKPPVRLLGTMFLLVLGLVAVYVGMALGIFTLVQRLVHLEDASYTAAVAHPHPFGQRHPGRTAGHIHFPWVSGAAVTVDAGHAVGGGG